MIIYAIIVTCLSVDITSAGMGIGTGGSPSVDGTGCHHPMMMKFHPGRPFQWPQRRSPIPLDIVSSQCFSSQSTCTVQNSSLPLSEPWALESVSLADFGIFHAMNANHSESHSNLESSLKYFLVHPSHPKTRHFPFGHMLLIWQHLVNSTSEVVFLVGLWWWNDLNVGRALKHNHESEIHHVPYYILYCLYIYIYTYQGPYYMPYCIAYDIPHCIPHIHIECLVLQFVRKLFWWALINGPFSLPASFP